MSELSEALRIAVDAVTAYRDGVGAQPVGRPVALDDVRRLVDAPLPEAGLPPGRVVADLADAAAAGLVATTGPRYFGFVIGGALPAATAADVLATGWDQVGFNATLSPAAIAVEQVAGRWAKELLGVPDGASVGFVTGAQEANTVGLAAARHHVLEEHGWDVEQDGLTGAPRVRVVASEERHATVDRSLRLLGLGNRSVAPVRADPQGAIDVDHLEAVLAEEPYVPTIVCLQSGNVNTGACDDLRRAVPLAHGYDAWAHVDGAFGLWAAASPELRHLTDGIELADSWGTDCHKWLNVPYDSGLVMVSRPAVHVAAASYTAAYLSGSGTGIPAGSDLVLGSSRRARGFAVYAAIRELGRAGVAALVEHSCRMARRFAHELRASGAEIGNEVVLNQVLVRFEDDETTEAVIAGVQYDGTCWMGATTWRGRRWMRISVSNHLTTEEDVDLSVAAIVRVWRG